MLQVFMTMHSGILHDYDILSYSALEQFEQGLWWLPRIDSRNMITAPTRPRGSVCSHGR